MHSHAQSRVTMHVRAHTRTEHTHCILFHSVGALEGGTVLF